MSNPVNSPARKRLQRMDSEKKIQLAGRESSLKSQLQCKSLRSTRGLCFEELSQWSLSLEKLIASKYGTKVFEAFLKSEFSDENIEFWMVCEEYKKTRSSFRKTYKAQKIFKHYIQAGAPREINIDHKTRDLIRRNVKTGGAGCFDEAQRIVYGLMERDSYPRFLSPTLRKTRSVEESLEVLLCQKVGQTAFRAFLKSEFSEENLDFWIACQEFKSLDRLDERKQRASHIYEEFISTESPSQVNLDFYTKEVIKQNLQQPAPSCFVAAQKKIYNLMENGSFPRFIQSEHCKDLFKCTSKQRNTRRL
ncbi:regulator of G-protein signaling 1-like [Corythoichthys intestinalis]|uniref:regulator of G-protein signaling 1-like n=1 Tax=Corythoichthys intestinalis TaxID=161448 RepID=UPI0025A5BEB1|nr:regulator of G-protein signaling 1-like [Corythoichthys intestinalis]